MLLSELVVDYVRFLRFEKTATPATCKTYGSCIRRMERWLDANGYPKPDHTAFNINSIRRYIYEKAEKGARPRTIKTALHGITSFGEFVKETGLIQENRAKAIRIPKLDPVIRDVPDDDLVVSWIRSCCSVCCYCLLSGKMGAL